MIKPLLLAAAAGLALAGCAQTRPEPVRTVFLSGPGTHVLSSSSRGPNRVVVIPHRQARGPLIIDGRHPGVFPGPGLSQAQREALERMTRDARLRGEEARRRGEEARQRGEDARRRGEEARARGEEARRRGEEARARGEEARRTAERLREQCERGEIACEIIVIR